MKRTGSSETLKNQEQEGVKSSSLSAKNGADETTSLAKSMNNLTIDFNVVDFSTSTKTDSEPTSPNGAHRTQRAASDEKIYFNSTSTTITAALVASTADTLHVGLDAKAKSKSMQEVSTIDHPPSPKKLISPYGDWCAFRYLAQALSLDNVPFIGLLIQ